jgi:hypothetical protein
MAVGAKAYAGGIWLLGILLRRIRLEGNDD